MAARLGYVLFWAFAVLAVAVFLGGAALAFHESSDKQVGLFAVFGTAALVVWLIGRGIRYVLAGD